MGFKPFPYNSVRMYLVTEEIIRGDRHDSDNAFQYNYVMLNLPGTEGYKPSVAWISKRRTDGSLASDFVCFEDDQRISGQGQERVLAAGHAISDLGCIEEVASPRRIKETRCMGRSLCIQ